jgi:hypothetical protein
MHWATFRVTFSQTNLVTLVLSIATKQQYILDKEISTGLTARHRHLRMHMSLLEDVDK